MLRSGVAPTGVMGIQQPPDIQTAIGALKAKLGGGRMPTPGESPPIVNMPTGIRTPPLPAGQAMPYPLRVESGTLPAGWGASVGPAAPRLGIGGAAGGAAARPAAPQPSQFDRDAAATGRWRGAARFAGGTPGSAQPDGPPPVAAGLQSMPQDLGVNQAPTANPFLQAALARQQQLGSGYGALLRGALQNQMAAG